MSVRERLIKGTAAMLIVRVFSMALMLVLNGCLTRWMPPAEIASYVAGTNVLILASLIGMAGLNQSMIRLVAGRADPRQSSAELLGRAWRTALVFSMLVTAVFFVLLRTGFGAWMKVDPRIVAAILVCSLLVSVHRLLASSLRSVHALASSSVLEGRSGGPLSNSVYFLMLALALWPGLTARTALWTFAAALAVTAPLGFFLLRSALRQAERPSEDRAEEPSDSERTENVFLFSLPFLVNILLVYFATEFDVLLASAYTSPEDTALFGTARRLMLQVLAPIQILTASFGSTIAELHARGERDKLAKTLRYAATLGSAVTIPMLVLCALFPEAILGTIFGAFYSNAATVFAIMTIGPAVNCLTGQCASLLMMSGRTTIVLVVKLTGAFLMVTVGAFAAQRYGIVGLAIASTTVSALHNIALWLAARLLTGFWTHASVNPKRGAAVTTSS